jgi:hypothetical protein
MHCHGCPDPGARAEVVVGRTCAPASEGIIAAIAIADVRKFCVLLRMLESSEMERRRVFATHHGKPADTLRLDSRHLQKPRPLRAKKARGTDVEIRSRIIEGNGARNVKNVRGAGVGGRLHLRDFARR